jgi:hypothetical protein
VKIATPTQKAKKWHIDQDHGVAGIFLSLAENLKDNVSLRKDLSYYGALRLDKPHALEKRKSHSAPAYEWDRVESSGEMWFRASAYPGNFHYAEFLAFLLRLRDLFGEIYRVMNSTRAASWGDIAEA